jgi:hypothetical protein
MGGIKNTPGIELFPTFLFDLMIIAEFPDGDVVIDQVVQ